MSTPPTEAKQTWRSRLAMGVGVLLAIGGLVALANGSFDLTRNVKGLLGFSETAPIEAFLTDTPDAPPEKESTHSSLLGISDGMTLKEIARHFGSEVSVKNSPDHDNDGWTTAEFEGHGVTILVDVETSTGATTVEGVRLTGYDILNHRESLQASSTYASLPNGLLLGHSTAKDILEFDTSAQTYAYWMEGTQATSIVLHEQEWGGDTPVQYSIGHGHQTSPGSTTAPWSNSTGEERLSPDGCQDVITAYWLQDVPTDTTDYRPISSHGCR